MVINIFPITVLKILTIMRETINESHKTKEIEILRLYSETLVCCRNSEDRLLSKDYDRCNISYWEDNRMKIANIIQDNIISM